MDGMDHFTGTDLACLRGERPVFAGLSFTLSEGGALLLLGPNGSGKSSLLRLMAGLLRPAGGELAWNGAVIGDEPDLHRRRCAYLSHASAAKAALTPAEDVAFWLRYRADSLASDAIAARVAESLAWAGLAALADMPSRFLSAGQRQRLALARLVAHPTARLWLLDEPATGLDAAGLTALAAAIAQFRFGGGMVVASTHQPLDLPVAATLELGAFAARRGEIARRAMMLEAVS